MKTILNISVVAVFLVVAPNPCFAAWLVEIVSKERAKELGMEVRSELTGPNVQVELELKPAGEWKNFNRVDLRVGDEDDPRVTASLREDRFTPGRVVVGFTAHRAQLDKLNLWVMMPESLGGRVYDLRVKDFVELKEDR